MDYSQMTELYLSMYILAYSKTRYVRPKDAQMTLQ